MVNNEYICPKCGSPMKQTGSDYQNVGYRCPCCGNSIVVAMTSEENSEYWHQRQELLHRVRMGVLEWQTTGWDRLAKDIVSFMSKHEKASNDVCFKIATIACLTNGFHTLNSEKYKESCAIFKITERAYKSHIKSNTDVQGLNTADDVATYKEYRAMYKKCRNDYRNTKMLWKIVFFFAKKLIKPF